jgi:hypothetical protein
MLSKELLRKFFDHDFSTYRTTEAKTRKLRYGQESSRPENSEMKNLRSNSFEQRTVFWSGYQRQATTK